MHSSHCRIISGDEAIYTVEYQCTKSLGGASWNWQLCTCFLISHSQHLSERETSSSLVFNVELQLHWVQAESVTFWQPHKMLSELTLLNWWCLAFKGPMNDYLQPDSAQSLGTEVLATSNGTESHCSFWTMRSCLLQHLSAASSAAQLEISRYQPPGGICSSVKLYLKAFYF